MSEPKGGDVFTRVHRGISPNQGVLYPQTGKSVQIYPDNIRHSEEDGVGHWTNQNLGKRHPERHTPPSDAR